MLPLVLLAAALAQVPPILFPDDHSNGVHSAGFSADSQWLATAAADGTMRLWHVPSRRVVRTLNYPEAGGVRAIAVAPGAAYAVLGSPNGTIALVQRAGGEPRVVRSGLATRWLFQLDLEGETIIGRGFTRTCRWKLPELALPDCTGELGSDLPPDFVVAHGHFATRVVQPRGVGVGVIEISGGAVRAAAVADAESRFAPGPGALAFTHADALEVLPYGGKARTLPVPQGRYQALAWAGPDLVGLRCEGVTRASIDRYPGGNAPPRTAEVSSRAGRLVALAASPDASPLCSAERAWLASNNRLLVVEGLGRTVILDLEAPEHVSALPETPELSFAPRGDALVERVADGSDGLVRIWSAGHATPLVLGRESFDERGFAAFAGDGTRLVTSVYRNLETVERATLGVARTLREAEGIAQVAVADRVAVFARRDGEVAIWELESGARRGLGKFDAVRAVGISADGAIAISPDGSIVAVAGSETCLVLDAKSGRTLATRKRDGASAVGLSFDRAGSRLAIAWGRSYRSAEPVEFLDVTRRAAITTLATLAPVAGGHVAVAALGDGFVAAGADHVVRAFDASGSPRFERALPGPVRSLATDRDGGRLAAVVGRGHVWFLDPTTGAELARAWRLGESWLAATPDGAFDGSNDAIAGARIATGEAPGSLAGSPAHRREPGLIARLLGRAPQPSANAPAVVAQQGDFGGVEALALAPSGRSMLVLAGPSPGRVVRHWDLAGGRLVRTIREEIDHLAISPDERLHALSGDNRVRLVDPRSGATLRELDGIGAVAFAPDGKTVALARYDALALHDPATGALLREIRTGELGARNIAFGGKGQVIATFGGDVVRWWDAASGRLLGEGAAHDPEDPMNARVLRVSPTERYVATSDGLTVSVFDVATGERVHRLAVEEKAGGATRRLVVTDLAFSPDGKLLAGAVQFGGVTLWSLMDGTARRFATADSASALAFGPEGRTLLAATAAGVVRLDLHDGEIVQRYGVRVGAPVAVDPTRLALMVDAGEVRRWDAARGTSLERAPDGTTWSPPNPLTNPSDLEERACFSGDGSRLVVGSYASLEVRAAAGGPALLRLGGGGMYDGVTTSGPVALDHAGKTLALVAGQGNGDLTIWSVATRKLMARTARGSPGDSYVRDLALSPDGRRVALASGPGQRGIAMYRTADGKKLWDADSESKMGAYGVAFEPAGGRLVVANATSAPMVLSAGSGKVEGRLLGHAAQIGHVAWAPDGTTIATGGEDGAVVIWDARTLRPRARLTGHEGRIAGVAFADRGRVLVSRGDEGTVRLWNVGDARPLASLVFSGSEFLLVDAEGRYFATRGALDAVGFRFGASAYPVEQFDLLLNRPADVLRSLGAAPGEALAALEAARTRRLRRMRVDPASLRLDADLPVVRIASTPPTATEARSIAIEVEASDARGLASLHVHVNDVPIDGSAGRPLDGARARVSVVVPLSHGTNKIQVAARNRDGVDSLQETLVTQRLGPPPARTLHVVSIGVSRYRDASRDLALASKDAEDLVAHFAASHRGFAGVRPHTLVDAQVTHGAVLALRAQLLESEPDDLVVALVAGHGLLGRDGEFYFATHATDFAAPEREGVPFAALEGLLDGIPARQKLLLVDACHSGEADEPAIASAVVARGEVARGLRGVGRPEDRVQQAAREVLPELFADLRRGSGAVVIAAAAAEQFAYESGERGNGFFTSAVLEALQGRAERNGDGRVQVSELRGYVVDRVAELTAGRQVPTARRENLANDFVVP